MKIPPSFVQSYAEMRRVLQRLEAVVRPRAQVIAHRYEGSYTGRIKTAQSTLIKAECRGYALPFREMNDLFACTITVPTLPSIEDVRKDIVDTFQIVEERQRALKPEEFVYSDLNLSARIRPDYWNRDEEYLDLVFEIQVKTLLQQAWSVATHDIVYKGKKRVWGLVRISSQLRALLEMADSVLADLEAAADILQGPIEYPEYMRINELVSFLQTYWEDERLPDARLRAATVVDLYLGFAGLTLNDLVTLVERPQYRQYATARSLTPTEAVFIILFLEAWDKMADSLGEHRVLVTPEMLDLCPDLAAVPDAHRMSF